MMTEPKNESPGPEAGGPAAETKLNPVTPAVPGNRPSAGTATPASPAAPDAPVSELEAIRRDMAATREEARQARENQKRLEEIILNGQLEQHGSDALDKDYFRFLADKERAAKGAAFNAAEFAAGLRKSNPALFAARPLANTATGAAPAAGNQDAIRLQLAEAEKSGDFLKHLSLKSQLAPNTKP